MLLFQIDGKKCFSPDVKNWLRDKQHKRLLSELKNKNLSSIVDDDGTTLLHLSVKHRNEYMTRYLINEKLDVNAVNSFGETPLMWATKICFHDGVWRTLLDAGADLWTIKNKLGQSALMMIEQKHGGHTLKFIMSEIEKRCRNVADIVDVFLGAEYKIFQVIVFKNTEITREMLERGCPVNFQDENQGNTALHIAAEMNDLDNVNILLQYGADTNIKNRHKYLPIVSALCNNSDLEVVKLLLPDDKDWMKKAMEKDHVIDIVFCENYEEVVQFLLQHYSAVDLNVKDRRGRTPLHHALVNPDPGVWQLLKKGEVNVNVTDNFGVTPLHLAVQCSKLDAVQYLLDAGANLNALDKEGHPPLYHVLHKINKQAHCKSMELLMQYGADAQLSYANGETIISYIVKRKNGIWIYPYDPSANRDMCHNMLYVIVTHLAIIESRGSILNPVILNQIEDDDFTRSIFTRCKLELDRMKKKIISGNTFTLYKFLTGEENKIWKYVRNDEISKELSQVAGTSYLHRLFVKRFKRAMEVSRLHLVASEYIGECIEPFMGNHEVLDKILNFLSFKDWELIATCTD